MGWIGRMRGIRDAIISDPVLNRKLTRLPIARFFAARYARSLFDICSGFVYSQVLSAAVQLNLFARLARQPASSSELAEELAIPADRLGKLLEACVALDLLERRGGGTYGLAALGAAVLANPVVPAMVRHHALLYADLSDPVALLKNGSTGTRLSAFWPYAAATAPESLGAGDVTAYSALMARSQEAVADEIIDSYPFNRHRRLLDIGGGEGVFLSKALAANPRLHGVVADLPSVTTLAQQRLATARLETRASVHGCDFFAGPLPDGFDVAVLIRVLFDHDDERVRVLLRRAHEALVAGGTVLIAEPLLDVHGKDPVNSAYFAFYLMAMGRGRLRTPDEIAALLVQAGFERCKRYSTSSRLLTGLMTARKSS